VIEIVWPTSAVRHSETRVSNAPPRTTDALDVVERLRRNVAKEDGIEITQIYT
jgi:hypothetical protein